MFLDMTIWFLSMNFTIDCDLEAAISGSGSVSDTSGSREFRNEVSELSVRNSWV